MAKYKRMQVWGGAILGGGLLLAMSCSVNTSNIDFDDDLLKSSGGNSGSEEPGGLAGGDGSGGSQASCAAGELSCAEKQAQICVSGSLIDVGAPCEFACDSGKCVGVCHPKETQCLSDTVVQTCDAKGEWGQAKVCKGSACVDKDCQGECLPGARRCEGKRPQSCDVSGIWVDARASDCEEECEAATGLCSTCEEDESQCISSTQYKICDNGAWGAASSCTNQACVGDSCTGVCSPGSKKCQSNTAIQICMTDGTWGASTACTNQACTGADGSAECTGSCQPGQTRCNGALIQVCTKVGAWADDKNCGSGGQICDDSFGAPACVTCKPGTERCTTSGDGEIAQFCTQQGAWAEKDKGVCYKTENPHCGVVSGEALCFRECVPGEVECQAFPRTKIYGAARCGSNGYFEQVARDSECQSKSLSVTCSGTSATGPVRKEVICPRGGSCSEKTGTCTSEL